MTPRPGRSQTSMKPLFHDRVRQALDNVIPPLRLAHRILEGDVVLRQGGRHLNMRGEPDKPVENPVGSDQDAVKIGVFRDPLQFRDPADIFRVGADNIDSLFFDQILEVLPQVDLFSGVNRDRSALRHFPKKFGVGVRRVVACDQVFEPRDVQRFQRSRKRDRVLYRPARSAVKGEPDFIAQDFLHGFDAGDRHARGRVPSSDRDRGAMLPSAARRTSALGMARIIAGL